MAVDYFLKLANIQGEATDSGHENEIKVQSWSWGAAQTSSVSGTSGHGAGKASLSELSITKDYDASSTKILNALLRGTHIATATLAAVKVGGGASGSNYMTMDLTEVFVTSQQMSASSEVPMESVSLSFKSLAINYFKQGTDGGVTNAGTVNYDVTTNVVS